MYEIFSPTDSCRLSTIQIALARQICNEAIQSIEDRSHYVEKNHIDQYFAIPDANWSYDAPNEFLELFIRVSKCEPQDIENLRALCQVFSGYNLYAVINAKGLRQADKIFSDTTAQEVKENLVARNLAFIDEWLGMVKDLPSKYLFKPPQLFGECGHLVKGVIVNNDTNTYQERVNIIYESGIGEWLERKLDSAKDIRICEIGGGYGALAFWFKQAFPQCSYTIIDLPESLLFSRLYLSLSIPQLKTSFGLASATHGVRFLPNYMAEKLDESFDLVINTLSMSEMSSHQVQKYVDMIKDKWIKGDGLFFEQNQDNRHMGLLSTYNMFASKFQEHVNLNDEGRTYRNGLPNIWSNKKVRLEAKLPRYRPMHVRHWRSWLNTLRRIRSRFRNGSSN